ncbi:MAG: Crp/Fnr family transcriptional regulator [Sphingomonadaceae bacterium]
MPKTLQLRQENSGRSMLAPTLFSTLAEPLRNRLLKNAPLRVFSAGQLIQRSGETPGGFWVIEKGRVTIGYFTPAGNFRAILVLTTDDSFGELSLLSGKSRPVDAIADGPASLRWIDAAGFEQALADDPKSLRALAGAMAAEIQEFLLMIASTSRADTAGRLAWLLANLVRTSKSEEKSVRINQQQLADLLGLTRMTVFKAIRTLEQEGLVRRGYGVISVPDLHALRQRSLG